MDKLANKRKKRSAIGTKNFVYDKNKSKVINDYKKLKRKEEKKNNFRKRWKPDTPQVDEDDEMNPMSVAYAKGQEVNRQKQQRQLEREKREKARQEKLKKRQRTHKKLSAKTPKGQPLMRNQVEFLLNKIQSNKELYCPSSKVT